MRKFKVAILGLGLIGGSIFKGLDKRKYEVVGISKSQSGKYITSDITSAKGADVVFICHKMSETLSTLQTLENIVSSNCIVSDVSSAKSFLKGQSFSYNFISTHPMAGTEKTGFNASSKNLFKGAKWVIEKNNKLLEKIIKSLGATPIVANPNEQDFACALISHMPTLLSYALMDVIDDNHLAQVLASSGFRDTTRLALGSPYLISDMLEYNKINIDLALDNLQNSLNKIKNLSYNEKVKFFEDVSKKRKKMYKNGKNQTH